MNYRNSYQGLFESWEVKKAVKVIEAFVSKNQALRKQGFDDLLQEVLIRWLFCRDKYRDDERRFVMKRVIVNSILDILKKQKGNKDKVNHMTADVPVDDFFADPDKDSGIDTDLVRDVIGELSLDEQRICELLMQDGTNLNDVALSLDMHRNTVYRKVKKIRRFFEEKGLNKFF